MQKRFIMRIELNGPSKKKLDTLSDAHGMKQVAMLSRLVEFFANQRDAVQTGMIGTYPADIRAKISQLILEDMALKK